MLPAYFLSHGSPMLTLDNNKYTQLWKSIGNEIQKPSAVLFISAHWYANKTSLTSNNPQKTIHDFYGFPDELHAIEYNPPNDIQILKKIQNELKEFNVGLDDSWGLDHGSWALLRHIYPNSNIPTMQLSINKNLNGREHYEIGSKLKKLRGENILILSSGNAVHNLRQIADIDGGYDWAKSFEKKAVNAVKNHDINFLINALDGKDDDAKLSIPTPEHYIPLLYTMGLYSDNENIEVLHGGDLSMGSVSMFSVKVG